MNESTARKWVVGGLFVLSVGIFGVGINWGLPSHQIDPILFGSGAESETNTLQAYRLSGAGIDKLAGDWDETGSVAADVAIHPIGDRSGPVTLVENRHGATVDELVKQGDQHLAKLMAAADAADRQFADVQSSDDKAKREAASDRLHKAQRAVNTYLAEYNQTHFPGLAEAVKQDAVNRARILRRYRLYSYQPDEMITFRALAMMRPGEMNFDPKLYQYGGLWIYPVGAILKAASLVNYVTLSGDRAYYLDSPEVFGRFYILARAYSAAWGIVGMMAVFAIVRRAAGGLLLSAGAAICFVCMPVVVDLAHEAKPHLAGTAILLLAVLAAGKYIETGRWKWIFWTAVACGAAAGMVLSGVVGLFVLPFMAILRRDRLGRFVAVYVIGVLIAAGVYFASNPYVAIHLVHNRQVLESNFTNTRAMYLARPSLINAARLVAVGMSWPVAVAGVIALFFTRRTEGWLLGTLAVVVLPPFVWHAANEPGEYARFALFIDVVLMLAAFLTTVHFVRPIAARAFVAVLLVGCACIYSFAYERGFWRDSLPEDSRMRAAAEIDARLMASGEPANLYLLNEPAPYCLPAVNLFHWHIVLLPRDEQVPPKAGTLVRVVNPVNVLDPSATPISWADNGFEVVATNGK
jgi:hypothetical protein